MRVSATGGTVAAVTTLGPRQTAHIAPWFLPDGRRFLFYAEGAPDTGLDHPTGHDAPADAHETITAFKLLSVRSVLAFATLFSWAGALYLDRHLPVGRAMLYALAWGMAALVLMSWLVYILRHMAETGNIRVSTTVGATGTIYLDVPAEGFGEIRVLCSGVQTHLRAKSAAGTPIKAGTAAKVVRVIGPNMVEVELAPVEERKDGTK